MTQTIIYVSCAESREIHVFSLDTLSGEVQLRQRVPTPGKAQPMKVSPDQRVLYVGTKSENELLAFGIHPDRGTLALLGRAPAPGSATYVACDQTMRVAFSASYGDNNLGVFPLDAQGAPHAASQTETELPRAHCARMDATNRWLLVPMLGVDAIGCYCLGDDLRLTPNNPAMTRVRPGSGPRHLVFSRDNRHVHCLNELDGSIDLFDFDVVDGTLTLKQSSSMLPPGFTGKPWAAELRATPDGRFLYATERRSSTLAIFSVDVSSGQLLLVGHTPTEEQPRGMDVDPSGRWLIAAGQLSSHLTVYSIDPDTGRPAVRHRHETGLDPICIEVVAL